MFLVTIVFACGFAWYVSLGHVGLAPAIVLSSALSGVVLFAHRSDIARILASVCGGILGAYSLAYSDFPFSAYGNYRVLGAVLPNAITGAIIGWLLGCTLSRLFTGIQALPSKQRPTARILTTVWLATSALWWLAILAAGWMMEHDVWLAEPWFWYPIVSAICALVVQVILILSRRPTLHAR